MDAVRGAGQFALEPPHSESAAGGLAASRPPDRVWHPGLSWLLTLRWCAVVGQLVLLVAAHFAMRLDLPYRFLLGLIAFTAVTTAALQPAARRPGAERAIPLVLVVDTLVLAAMLVVSGGPSNPFSVFFIVHVAIGALLLEPRGMWLLVGLTVAMFGSLFFVPGDSAHAMHAHHGGWSGHLVGMWIAYVFTAAFVAQLIAWISSAMRERDRTMARMAEQNERLAALSSFSANAAHELGTPLATISIAAHELARALESATPADARRDAGLISDEVARCRDILRKLSSRAGESMGEMPVLLTRATIAADLTAALSGVGPARLDVSCPSGDDGTVFVPRRTLVQMLVNLVENALHAHVEAGVAAPVEVQLLFEDGIRAVVSDRGPGLPAFVRARVGDPFITTRAESGGLGLGIYLALSFADRIGGRLELADRPGGGTTATLFVPRDAARREHDDR